MRACAATESLAGAQQRASCYVQVRSATYRGNQHLIYLTHSESLLHTLYTDYMFTYSCAFWRRSDSSLVFPRKSQRYCQRVRTLESENP